MEDTQETPQLRRVTRFQAIVTTAGGREAQGWQGLWSWLLLTAAPVSQAPGHMAPGVLDRLCPI